MLKPIDINIHKKCKYKSKCKSLPGHCYEDT